MEVLIDWLSFTVKEYEGKTATVEGIIEDILELDPTLFQETGRGGYGYKTQHLYNDVRIYSNGSDDMGIHVVISGNGIRFLENEKHFEWKGFFFLLINWFNAKVSRLDLALDDFEGILNLDTIEGKMKTGEIVTRWRTGKPVCEYKLVDGTKTSATLYFGSRTSEVFCRFYDKKKEQENKEKIVEHDTWIRCELEIHGDRAQNFLSLYSEKEYKKEIGEMFGELLNNYMRITDRTEDENRSRWPSCQMWQQFMTAVNKLVLSIKKPEKKIEDVYNWVKKSVSPSLNMLFQASYGDLDILLELIKEGGRKLNKKHLIILMEFMNREMRNQEPNNIDQQEEKKQHIQSLASLLSTVYKKKAITYEQIPLPA